MTALISPMLASPSTGSGDRHPVDLERLMATGDWVLDTKLDGIRAMAADGRLYNRQGVDITERFPEIAVESERLVLDGEIVSVLGSFEAVAQRDKLIRKALIAKAAESNPCVFIAFDCPFMEVAGWRGRRYNLEQVASVRDLPITPTGGLELWHRTAELGMEGVIAKRLDSRYQPGKRSADWIKFKHLHRITCLIAGYDPGQGSRSHLGALLLALYDTATGDVVSVGRCGSGFTERQTHELKARLDAGELLMAEIETLNVTSHRTLRFPVFRGLRTDLSVLDCTLDQLTQIPHDVRS